MKEHRWCNLQLFAGEGTGEGGGDGTATGDNAVDAGQQRLLELGVPAEKLRKRAKRTAINQSGNTAAAAPKAEPQQQSNEQAAAANNTQTDESHTDKPARMSWKEIMDDPEYNREMQATIQARLRTAKDAEDTMSKLAPALEVLARKYNLDPDNMDYGALTQAINNDDGFYEDKALELGVPLETAKKIDQEERAAARQKREEARTLEQQKIQQHIQKLQEQGEALKKIFPNFDLRTELQDPAFARMTAPGVGISVEDAYYAVHRKAIQTAAMQVTAQKTAQKISNSIQAGQRRPMENGTSAQAPSVTTFDYKHASQEQRNEFKRKLRERMARGEKVYPGQI